jgi:Methyltransferase domain
VSTIETYLRRHTTVPGWLHSYSAAFIADLSRIQTARGINGSVAEIGVHMGRLFILLKLLTQDTEQAIAIDVFGDQHLNTDRSGFGDQDRFLHNVAEHTSMQRLVVLQRSSLEVEANDILRRVGRCRLFSIDGGHTEDCTLNDLTLAEGALEEDGVAILDDYFNENWPDVSTGAARYFCNPATELRPFAITPNKLFLAKPRSHAMYHTELRRSQQDFHEKDSRMFGHDVVVFGVEPGMHRLPKTARRWVRDSPLGPSLMVARQRLRAVAHW